MYYAQASWQALILKRNACDSRWRDAYEDHMRLLQGRDAARYTRCDRTTDLNWH